MNVERQASAIAAEEDITTKVRILEERLMEMSCRYAEAMEQLAQYKAAHKQEVQKVNSEGIPLNSCLYGVSKGIPFMLMVNPDGAYIVGGKIFNSLSAAAESVSGVRRSGWTFWRLPDGKTAKEAFKIRHG